jgi:ABC-type molybdate transport system substrate-binding protein
MRDRAIGLFFIIFGCGLAAPIRTPYQAGGLRADDSAAVELSVAAPEELNPAITEVAEAFEQKTGNRVRLTFGDSASLYLQIRNGARFDAFFSTDMDHPRRLVASGTATGGSLTEYAHDNLVLWISPVMRLGIPARNPLLIVRDKSISHIAIADPNAPLTQGAPSVSAMPWSACDEWTGNGRAWLPKKSSPALDAAQKPY